MNEVVDEASETPANLVKNMEKHGANFEVLPAPLKSESDMKKYK